MLPPAYDAKQYEESIYKKWESSGAFKAKVNPAKKPFTIAMPPPNVTGTLHLGHAVMLAIEDIMIRHRRMKGYEALWIPGTDHAAIATQNKVEKILAGEGMTREKLGREMFLSRVREFVAGSKDTIRNQIRKMGSSCDWSRERYTLDDDLSTAVTEIFVRMYEDGLIYRGYRIVNWCPRCESTLANDEVEHEEQEGNFYHILYPFKGEKGGLVVATTRPETMLGDTAVAVNPKDKRYKKYIGKTIVLPLVNREIPVIGDSYVDLKTGTGALKVTPAHDPNDFEIGKRHKLQTIRILDGAGRINEAGKPYTGLDRFTARQKILDDLKAKDLLIKVEPLKHNVGHCYRCSTMIEPLTSDQWFIDVNKKVAKLGGKSLKERSLEVVKDKSIQIIPDRFKKIYLNWMGGLYDWCISRQIWWGHRIPVWNCENCKEVIVAKETPKACPKCHSTKLVQDHDTLDTWFSSGLWTFSTLGWPKQTEDLKYFHPTSMMETGYDILFFWIARMILMTTYALDDIPFQKVYLHGLVRARDGKKMSKSLGNGIDPIEMIEKYGTDALRMSMVVGTTPGNDVRLYEEKIEGYRNFTNKLWNASRFVLSILDEKGIKDEPKIDPKKLSDADQWILGKLNDTIKRADKGLDKFNIGETGQLLYDFLWNDYCDWYLELSKGEKQNPAVLLFVLRNILHLLHPYMPFVTEEIWSHVPGSSGFLMLQPYPTPSKKKYEGQNIQLIIELIGKIRYLKAENKIDPAKKIPMTIYAHGLLENVEKNQAELVRLARISELTLGEEGVKIPKAANSMVNGMEIFIPMEGLVDTAKEKIRLGKEIQAIEAAMKGMKARLDNLGFLKKAPPAVVEKDRATLLENEEKLVKLKAQWAQF
jgi:valyl-tRNA synthetase